MWGSIARKHNHTHMRERKEINSLIIEGSLEGGENYNDITMFHS